MHLNLDDAIALACFAATALDVKTEAARHVAARPGLLGAGKQFANRGKQATVGGRVGARCAADRALADVDNAVDMLQSKNFVVWCGIAIRSIELVRDSLIQGVVNECRLSGTGHAGNAGHQTEWYRCFDALQIIAGRADDDDQAIGINRRALIGKRNSALA